MTDEPKISDAECEAIERALDITCDSEYWRAMTRQALAAFLKSRVPEPKQGYGGAYENGLVGGFNACREAVLNGRADGK